MNEPIPLPGSGSGSTGTMPRLGLGVYQLRGEECFAACLAGLEAGYRHIDTARLYGNEEEVGRAVGVFLRRREEGSSDGCGDGRGVEGAGKSRVQREHLFLTTKVGRWEGDGEKMYESVLGSVMRIAGGEEGGGYVDLILVHRPVARWRDIWSVLGRFLREGRARVLGVSNFGIGALEEMKKGCEGVLPCVNQIERELVAYCQQNGIVVQAYSPLARGQRWADPVLREVVERVRRRVGVGVREDSIPVSGRRVAGTNCRNDDPRERETAVTKKREITEATVTPAQVLIRWSLQRGYVPLPKSADAERIRENGDVFWFKLDEVEMGMLDGLDLGAAGALFPKNRSQRPGQDGRFAETRTGALFGRGLVALALAHELIKWAVEPFQGGQHRCQLHLESSMLILGHPTSRCACGGAVKHFQRPLRGGCQCGRNSYIIEVPQGTTEKAQVLFHTDSMHRVPLATPLAAMIRVPLSWYHSSTHAFYPDERHSAIRRVFESPSNHHPSRRNFCGFCGTPLSYWTERPPTEAGFIHLTLASLRGEDLRDLEDLGLIPEFEEPEEQPAVPTTTTVIGRETQGVPWFEGMIDGTRLGNLRHSQVVDHSRDGKIRVEWEIVEWTEGDDTPDVAAAADGDVNLTTNHPGKRKMNDREDEDAAVDGMH
ncbi:hypothetical protein CSPX01_09050 [Colletotrichum filicis]|nr:hypothetical protein CSPX01_09050 [Colletotrichum filicis]